MLIVSYSNHILS